MKIAVHTERGMFVSGNFDLPDGDKDSFVTLIREAASGYSSNLKFGTDDGYVVLGGDLLRTSVFVVTE